MRCRRSSTCCRSTRRCPRLRRRSTGLNSLATNPIPLFRNEFTQTDASIADIAGQVKDQKDKVTLAKETVPRILVALGVVLGVGGLVLVFVGSRRARSAVVPDSDGEVAT